MRVHHLALLLLTLPAFAAEPPKHRADGDAAIAARRVLLEHCAPCHGPDADKRHGRLTVNDPANLKGNQSPVPFVSTDKEDDYRSQIIEFMKDGSMPPGGRKPVPREQVAVVEAWIKREAPVFPPAFDDDAVLALIAADITAVEKEKGKDHVQHVRYVSLSHLVDQKGADLRAEEDALVTALAGRTHGAKFRLTKSKQDDLKREGGGVGTPPVLGKALRPLAASAGTVYRLDTKELGWDGGGKLLFEWTISGTGQGDFRMKPFDLIQLEYPYSHTPTDPTKKKAADAVVAAMNTHRNKAEGKDPLAQLRAVPFVRGDWLAKALWKDGKPTALADDLDSLGELAGLLANTTELRAGVGPDFAPFAGGPKLPPDATAPPLWAWYQAAVAPPAPPFAFTATVDGKPPFYPQDKVKLMAESDKAAAVSVIEVLTDFVDMLRFGDGENRRPTTEVQKPTALSENRDGSVQLPSTEANGRKPLFYLFHASPQATPHGEPVVVRSKHERSNVWRVVPNAADAAAGRGPAVRQVLRVEVEADKRKK